MRNLKFKSEILPRGALWFELPLCFEISLCLSKSSYSKILSRFEIPLCFKTLPRRPEILRGGLNEILRREIFCAAEFYAFKFYKLSTPPCVHRSSIYRILSVKFEREILKFHVAVISEILR